MARRSERPYHHGDLRRALLREAAALLRSEGLAALSLRRVARRAGVSPAAPYAHFADKSELVAALAEDGFRRLVAALRRSFRNAHGEPLRRLKAMTAEYVHFAREHPAQFQIMFGPDRPVIEKHAHLHETAHEAAGVMASAMLDCQQSGQAVAGDTMELMLFAWVIAHGLAVLLLAGMLPRAPAGEAGRAALTRLVESYVDRAIAGLAPRETAPRRLLAAPHGSAPWRRAGARRGRTRPG